MMTNLEHPKVKRGPVVEYGKLPLLPRVNLRRRRWENTSSVGVTSVSAGQPHTELILTQVVTRIRILTL
jgi:hypothetical protein